MKYMFIDVIYEGLQSWGGRQPIRLSHALDQSDFLSCYHLVCTKLFQKGDVGFLPAQQSL